MKIDKDCYLDARSLRDYIYTILTICRIHRVKVLSVQKANSSRKGFHLYVHIAPSITALKALQLQMLLGDDAQRVSINRARISAGYAEWNKLWFYPHRRLRTIYDASQFRPEHEKQERRMKRK